MRRALTALATVVAISLAAPQTVAASSAEPLAARAVVDLSEQRASFFAADGSLLASFAVSTGAPATPTPLGRFRVWRKNPSTFPVSDPSVRMAWMSNFRRGVGFHGIPYRTPKGVRQPLWTPLGVRGVSHGCVRMRDRDARWVFKHLPIGALVVVQA